MSDLRETYYRIQDDTHFYELTPFDLSLLQDARRRVGLLVLEFVAHGDAVVVEQRHMHLGDVPGCLLCQTKGVHWMEGASSLQAPTTP